MRVAIVNESLPYPANAGNRIRTLNLMLRLAKRHQITYICRAADNEKETRLGVEYLRDHGIRPLIADEAPSAKKGLGFYAKLAGNLLSAQPYAVASHNSPRLRQTLTTMAENDEVDLWQFEWLAYADAVAHRPDARTLVVAHNVESLIWQRWYETETGRAKKWYLKQQWRKFARYEREIFAAVSGVICVSDEDAKLAAREFEARRLWVVDNGIDRAFFEQAKGQREAKSILFLGSLEWRPNLDAIRLMLDTIFPQVLQRMPEAKLVIVGRRPPQWLKEAVAKIPQATLHADVPDVRTFLAGSAVMAVPLRVGGGSRLKILEALACGMPVVSSAVGCEGLSVLDGRELAVSSIEQFAEKLVWAVDHPEQMLGMAEAGRRLVYEKYDWDVLSHKLEFCWEQTVRGDAPQETPQMEGYPQAVMT